MRKPESAAKRRRLDALKFFLPATESALSVQDNAVWEAVMNDKRSQIKSVCDHNPELIFNVAPKGITVKNTYTEQKFDVGGESPFTFVIKNCHHAILKIMLDAVVKQAESGDEQKQQVLTQLNNALMGFESAKAVNADYAEMRELLIGLNAFINEAILPRPAGLGVSSSSC